MNQKFLFTWKNIRLFATAMRSSDAVSRAFQHQPVLRCWWRCILGLHRKPAPIQFSTEEYWFCVADGFRFYGWLYRTFAMLLLGVLAVSWTLDCVSSFWLCLLGSGAVYLWVTTSLAFDGANALVENVQEGVARLVSFLFFIAGFLAVTLSAISLLAHTADLVCDTANLALTGALAAFGVGSYMIELIALVSANTRQHQM